MSAQGTSLSRQAPSAHKASRSLSIQVLLDNESSPGSEADTERDSPQGPLYFLRTDYSRLGNGSIQGVELIGKRDRQRTNGCTCRRLARYTRHACEFFSLVLFALVFCTICLVVPYLSLWIYVLSPEQRDKRELTDLTTFRAWFLLVTLTIVKSLQVMTIRALTKGFHASQGFGASRSLRSLPTDPLLSQNPARAAEDGTSAVTIVTVVDIILWTSLQLALYVPTELAPGTSPTPYLVLACMSVVYTFITWMLYAYASVSVSRTSH